MGSPRLIYDGECGICRAMVERLPWFDPEGRWEALPYQSLGDVGLRELGLTPAECARAVQVVTGQGRVFAGPWAVNYLLWERWPGRILVTILFMLPPLLLLEWIGYRLVARYRSRLSGWLGLTACAVSPPPALTPAEPKERGRNYSWRGKSESGPGRPETDTRTEDMITLPRHREHREEG